MTFAEALALHRAGRLAEAERAYREVLARETHPDALCNLGLILKDRRDFAEAETMLKHAVVAAPDKPIPIYNLGNLYQLMGRPADALPCFETAVRQGSGASANLNLGMCQLALGRFADGWTNYDARPEHANSQAHKLGFPEWKGEPLAGKRLFIWPEQGFGDQIFAARFIPLLGAAEVTFVCSPELAPLFAQLPATIVPRRGDISVEPHDYWSIPLSLPRWLNASPTSPYLSASPRPTGARIGVAWKGNDRPDPLRSLSREAADQLLALPGAISLHPEDSGARDFKETAELIAGLDLIVTIDTSVAHLAGALGKPTLVLVHHHAADWRWYEAQPGRSFWYPSVTLLRQPEPGDWASVVEEVRRRAAPPPAHAKSADATDLIARARLEYERLQDEALSAGPLADMATWVATGDPPPAQALRDTGLTTQGQDEATSAQLRLARMAFTRRWGFSIPCREAVEALRALGPLVEVGAGTGYWSSLLQSAGIDIIATDPAPRANPHGFETGRYTGTATFEARDAIQAYADRSVFCSWPTEGEAWAAEAFADLRPGLHLALIGTDRGGITGSPELFDLFDAQFSVEQEVVIPQFPQVHDRLVIYRRR